MIRKILCALLGLTLSALADFSPPTAIEDGDSITKFFNEKFDQMESAATAICINSENASLISVVREDGGIRISLYTRIAAIKNWPDFPNRVVQIPEFPFKPNQKDLTTILNIDPRKIISLQADQEIPVTMCTIASQQIDTKKYSRIAGKITLFFDKKEDALNFLLKAYEFYKPLPISKKLSLNTEKRVVLIYGN